MKKLIPVFLLLLLFGLPKPIFTYKPREFVVLENVQKLQDLAQETELRCLAQNIFYEAVGEPLEGKLAVAAVTLNRVKHSYFPNTICGVVFQSNSRGCQFSWTCGPKARFNQAEYDVAHKIASQVLTTGRTLSRLKNALYFHSVHVTPNWDFAEPIEQIGNHIFYKVIPYERRIASTVN